MPPFSLAARNVYDVAMNADVNLRHHEEEAQKNDIVSFVALLTNSRPEISQVVRMLEGFLMSAYRRGVEAGRRQKD